MATYTWDPVTSTFVLSDDQLFAVTTDQSDYAPGSTATFTTNVTDGGTVVFDITHVEDPTAPIGVSELTVVDNGSGDTDPTVGIVQTTWYVDPAAANQSFVLTATDASTGVTATTSFTDTPASHTPVPAIVPGTLTNGIVFLTGDVDTSTGTGIFPAFVQIQGDKQDGGTSYNDDGDSSTEEGFNTLNPPILDTDGSAQHNHPLLFSAVPTVTIGTTVYREFRLDLNDQGTTINLDSLKIYSAATGDLTSLTTLAGATELYDMNGGADGLTGGAADTNLSVVLTAWASGSGHSDYKVLIKDSYFTGTTANDFIYLYSAFSHADAGFEEWSVGPVGPTPGIHIDKVTGDGVGNDGDLGAFVDGDGVQVTGFQDIVWTYTVTNTGNVALSNVTVTDDQLGQVYLSGDTNQNGIRDVTESWVANGDTNNDGKLDTTETWVFTANGTALNGASYFNVGTATGQYLGSTVSASDPSSYISSLVVAEISINKVTVDGATEGDGLTILAGEPISWKYTVTNPGDLALKDVTVTDDQLGQVYLSGDTNQNGIRDVTESWVADGDSNNNGLLDTSETWIFTATGTAIDTSGLDGGIYSNVGHVQGTAVVGGQTVSFDDSSSYFGAAPEISIAKNIVCDDHGTVFAANTAGTAVHLLKDADTKVQYQIVVTNTGNVALASPTVTDSKLTLGSHTDTETGSGTAGDDILDVGETWTYTVLAAWAAGLQSNTANASVSFTDSAGHTWSAGDGQGVSDSAYYIGLNPHIALTKLTNGSDGPTLLAGQAITWTYDVKNDGNVDLTGVVVTDSPSQTITGIMGTGLWAAFNSGDSDHDNVLDQGETWHFKATGTAVDTSTLAGGIYSNTATAKTADVSDDCGDSAHVTATDGSSYTGLGQTLAGLTKGYWANHSWAGIDPNSTTLVLGDVNNDGLANDGLGTNAAEINHSKLNDLTMAVTVAQALANSSSTTDARIILAGQLVAAQMNDYNDFKFDGTHLPVGGHAGPNGLIEEGVLWLTGNNFGIAAAGTDAAANVDTNHNGVLDSGEFSIAKNGSISFTSAVLSSSSTAWNKTWQTVFNESTASYTPNTGNAGVDATHYTVTATGEGLKNALAAYNHGLDNSTAGFVISNDGSTIGWQDSLGGTVYDVHANTVDAFWGILEDQNLLGIHPIAGIGHL
jgi:uncharacterized repeat protein (TIGR01451 family)